MISQTRRSSVGSTIRAYQRNSGQIFFSGALFFPNNDGEGGGVPDTQRKRSKKFFPDTKKRVKKIFRTNISYVKVQKIFSGQILVKIKPISAKLRFRKFFLNPLFISKNVPHYFFLFSKFGEPPYTGGPGQISPSAPPPLINLTSQGLLPALVLRQSALRRSPSAGKRPWLARLPSDRP